MNRLRLSTAAAQAHATAAEAAYTASRADLLRTAMADRDAFQGHPKAVLLDQAAARLRGAAALLLTRAADAGWPLDAVRSRHPELAAR